MNTVEKPAFRCISASEAISLLRGEPPPIVFDVRDMANYQKAHLDGAAHLSEDRLLAWISRELPGGIAISSLQLYAQGDVPPETKQQSAGGESKGLDMLARFMTSPPKEKPAQEVKVAAEPGVYTLSLDKAWLVL